MKIEEMPTADLEAIVRSTSPTGSKWLELVRARDELGRRPYRAITGAVRGHEQLHRDVAGYLAARSVGWV